MRTRPWIWRMMAISHRPLIDLWFAIAWEKTINGVSIRRYYPDHRDEMRRVSRSRGTYTSTCLLRFALFICLFFFLFCFIVTHPYACYELFKKFALALHSSRSFFSLAIYVRSLSFFSGFFRWFFRTKQNGIFLALEEKIHSSTFISFLKFASPSPSSFSLI